MFWSAALVVPLASIAAAKSLTPTDDCPILGPTFPSDFDLVQSKAIKDAISVFPGLVEKLFQSEALNRTETAFAIDVFSTQTNDTIYSYSYAGESLQPFLTKGVLDDETVFRIGSVSKLHTSYALLAVAGIEVFSHPVTKYLPELACNDTQGAKIKWDEITVGALASQQGGTGGFLIPTALCQIIGNCSIPGFLAEMRDVKRPVLPAFHDALYSDSGWGVLGRVLERLTNQTYADALKSVLADPLDMKSVDTFVPPSDGLNALAIIGPDGLNPGVSSWAQDNQITAPSGGIYSNTHDLRTLGLSILQSRLLSPSTIRHWMKPLSHTASLTSSVGAPWEIARLTLPVSPASNRTRVSDLYTKLGGQVGYSAVFALSPDHGIGYSVLVAGVESTSDRMPLRDLVGTVFVTAAEHAAFENAVVNYAGTFADPNNEGSNLTLTVDADKAGLGLPSFFVDDVDWRSNIAQPALTISGDVFSFRLYPSGLEFPSSNSKGLMKTFQAVAGLAAPKPRAAIEGGAGLFDNGCEAWQQVGFFTTSEFELEVIGGKVESVRHIDANVTMRRVE